MPVFAIIILLMQSLTVDWNLHMGEYNQNSDTPESIWATTLLYYSTPDSLKDEVYESIESELVKHGLESADNFKESVGEINQLYKDESLLLLSLLLESDAKVRESLYSGFYDENEYGPLQFINLHAKNGTKIEPESIDISEFRFYHFLLSFYMSANSIVETKFFEEFSTYWSTRLAQSQFDDITKELLLATVFKAAYEINNYSIARDYFEPSFEYTFLPPSNLKRNYLWGIDFMLSRLGQVDKSIRIQQELTIPLSRFINDQNGLNSIQVSLGANLYHLGNYQKAREIFTGMMAHTDEFSPAALSRLYNNLSLIYFKTGESAEYVDLQSRALDLAIEIENYGYQLQIYRNLHIFHRKNRNWDLAEQYILRAIELASDTDNVNDQISIYISRAAFEDQYLNNRKEAFRHLKSAEDLVDESTGTRHRISVIAELSKLLNKEENWEASKELQLEIIKLSLDAGDPSTYLEAYVELAFVHFQLGEFSETERLLREFRAHDITILDFPTLVLAQTLTARLSAHSENTADANEQYSSITDLVFERARNTSELETGYWNVEPEYLHLFESYADFLTDNGKYTDALNLLDRIKTINDATLTDNPLIQASQLSDEELAAEQNLTNEMDRIRKRIFTTSGRERLSLQNRLEQLSAERRSLFKYGNSAVNYESSRIWSLQRHLERNQALIHITEINSNYYLSTLNRNSVSIEKLTIEESDIEMFETAVSSLVSGRTDLESLYKIGQFINIQSIPDYIESLIFIPDGYFHQIPLAVLPVRKPDSSHSYGSARYMIEERDIRTLNSLNDLNQRSPRFNHEYDYTGFGVSDFNNEATSRNLVSLPMAPEEVENISLKLNRLSSKNSLVNSAATVDSFRELAGKSRILHMATHSEVSESDPLFSRLHFYANSNATDGDIINGQLFAYEFFELNMQNELVMLNSCESGGDRYLQGSGIMGISRALRYAGVQSLVLNAWSVNDQFAAEFAELFYEYLNSGETKSKALQLAKVDFIKSKNSNPHYWGPYILNGDNRPIIRSTEINYATFTLAIAFFMGLLLVNRSNVKRVSA
jgi:CHAT domain-containing protein